MKKLLSVLAASAVTVSLSGCQAGQTDTVVSETTTTASVTQSLETTAPENTDIVYETLAEGQERDWKIEDVLKNDLEIDGIPISIPCTVEELLNTLGDGYSVNEANSICYNNEETMLSIFVINEDDNGLINATVCGCYFTHINNYEKGILGLKNINDTYYEIINKYHKPNIIENKDSTTWLRYNNNTCYFHCHFRNENLVALFIGFNTGGEEK